MNIFVWTIFLGIIFVRKANISYESGFLNDDPITKTKQFKLKLSHIFIYVEEWTAFKSNITWDKKGDKNASLLTEQNTQHTYRTQAKKI